MVVQPQVQISTRFGSIFNAIQQTRALLGVYSPNARSLVFIGIYCAFFGIVIQSIVELSQVFEGLGAVTAEPLETLLAVAREQLRPG